jgi:hypothetical protein
MIPATHQRQTYRFADFIPTERLKHTSIGKKQLFYTNKKVENASALDVSVGGDHAAVGTLVVSVGGGHVTVSGLVVSVDNDFVTVGALVVSVGGDFVTVNSDEVSVGGEFPAIYGFVLTISAMITCKYADHRVCVRFSRWR